MLTPSTQRDNLLLAIAASGCNVDGPTIYFSDAHLRFWRDFGAVMGKPPVYVRSKRSTYFVRPPPGGRPAMPKIPELLKTVEINAKVAQLVGLYHGTEEDDVADGLRFVAENIRYACGRIWGREAPCAPTGVICGGVYCEMARHL